MQTEQTIKVRCPDYSDGGDLIGCGHEYEEVLDWEGWADCPNCGLAFRPAIEAEVWLAA